MTSIYAEETGPKSILLGIGEYPPYATNYSEVDRPHSALEGGGEKSQGISSFFLKKTFEKMGMKAEISFLPWQLSMIEARKGEVFQGSFLWSKTKKREGEFYFSDPLLETIIVFFHRKKFEFSWEHFKNLEKLKKIKIGTTLEYTYGKTFDEVLKTGTLKVIPAVDIISNLNRLIKGVIDIFPVEPIIGKYYLKKIAKIDPISANLLTFNKKALHKYKLHLILTKRKDENKDLIEKFNEKWGDLKKKWGSPLVLRPCFSLSYIPLIQAGETERFKNIKAGCQESESIFCKVILQKEITPLEKSELSFLEKSCS